MDSTCYGLSIGTEALSRQPLSLPKSTRPEIPVGKRHRHFLIPFKFDSTLGPLYLAPNPKPGKGTMRSSIIPMLSISLILASGCDANHDAPNVAVDRSINDLAQSPIPEEATHETDAWAKLGVARVTTVTAPTGLDHRALLFDASGAEVGSIEVATLEAAKRVTTRVAGFQAQIDLGDGGTLRFTDLATGRTGETRFDPNTKKFTADPMVDTLQAEFADIIPISMGTLNAIQQQADSDAADQEVDANCPFDSVQPSTDALWYACTGEWHRGGAWWGTRSGCCYKAKLDAANDCSNWLCLGCCYYRSCDSWCSNGDYFCVCGVTGRECS